MTIQPESASPFQATTDEIPTDSAEQFSFRTMQDDLLAAQKNLIPTDKKELESQKTKEVTTNSPLPRPTAPVEKPATSPNPFIKQAPQTTTPTVASKPVPSTSPFKDANMIEVPVPEKNTPQAGGSAYKIVMGVIIFLVMGIVALGGYYFWITRTPNVSEVTQPLPETEAPIEKLAEPAVITDPVEKYSTNKPNYLVVEMEKASDTELQSAISTVAGELKTLPSQSPYEFTVVDANNNPITFAAFATAAKLNFSPTLLSTLGENFSLFIFIENNISHLGLAFSTTQPVATAAELQKQEATLSTDLAFLFLDIKPELTTGLFKDGTYKSYKTRYLNLNAQGTVSIDYAITDNSFIIGTNKDTLRAILDKQVAVETEASVSSSIINDGAAVSENLTNTETSTPVSDPTALN